MDKPMVGLIYKHDNMGRWQLFVKRVFDIILSSLLLIVLMPVMVVVALLLRMQRTGTILFRQERIGKNGVPFTIVKFRTLVQDNEADGPKLTVSVDNEKSTNFQNFLRKTHLDEMPQLWNILRGDMSFVGPRPERQFFIDKIYEHTSDYDYVLQIQPGLTSEAAIYNGYTDTMEKMLKRMDMDIRYLENRTLWLDLTILSDTFFSMFKNKCQTTVDNNKNNYTKNKKL